MSQLISDVIFQIMQPIQLFRSIKNQNQSQEVYFQRMAAIRTFSLHQLSNSAQKRNSTTYLQGQTLKNQITRKSTLTPRSFHSSKNINNFRLSSLNKDSPQTHRQSTRSPERYDNLKKTLNELELKINHARNIFKSTHSKRQNDFVLIQESSDVEESESTIHKKNEETGFDQTENSTKLFSFCRNESNKFTPCKPVKSSREINSYKPYYLKQIQKLFHGQQHQRIHGHLLFSIQVFRSLTQIEAPHFSSIEEFKINIPNSPQHKNKKTLILDIDQTILHSDQIPITNHDYDFILNIKIQNDQMVKVHVNLRPYALTFLKNMSNLFEIIAFTASDQSYANQVLNQIDPDNEIFASRLYRNNCFEINENIYTKDLRIINRSLERMVIVDNSPYSYIFQLENGIPILPYYHGHDRQLPELEKYLEKIHACPDVRQLNKETFKLHKYQEYEDVNGVMGMYFDFKK